MNTSRPIPGPCLLLAAAIAFSLPHRASAEQPLDFNRDVRPILSDKCFQCHGPDEATRMRKLRLDTFEGATTALASGTRAIVPGDPESSELWKRITAHDVDERMPPAQINKSLTGQEIDVLRLWITQGAEYQAHWAFIPPRRPALPEVERDDWPRNAIDWFILARLESDGLAPSPQADRAALIRRVSLDLTGLPPTIAEIDAFLADASPDAYEKVVDRLLASPHYGEHMARTWLDLARYADTHGYQYDQARTMWPWRDWVIAAYNDNMPFDRYTIEQLAGDLLPKATEDQRIATGFNRNHPITVEGGIIDEEYRAEYVIDRVSTTATVWMAMTAACARCHDHKFDPISQVEFYELYDFFNHVPEAGNGATNQFAPTMKYISGALDERLEELDRTILARRGDLDRLSVAAAPHREAWERSLRDRAEARWEVLTPVEARAGETTSLQVLNDASLLASGQTGKETYEITLRTEQTGITAVRLEALTHDLLPHRGPGRADNANFVLTEFEARAVSLTDRAREESIAFALAVADHSQGGYDIARAIDGDFASDNGWAVDGPTRREDRTAVFVARNPFGFEGGTEIQLTLHFKSRWDNHAIGRPRFAITRYELPAVPIDIDRILAIAPESRTPQDRARLDAYYFAQHAPPEVRAVNDEIASLEREKKRVQAEAPSVMVMRDMPNRRESHLLYRGEYDKPRQVVHADVPAALGALPADSPRNRLGLARWLVSPEHPLTARVTVNRYWQKYFGTGIVKTSEDFGSQADWPSHPELLDYLAVEFVESGWDVKHMQKLIVTSAAYRQSSRATPDLIERDPENRLLARGPRLRMEAEVIRDTALAASGLLTRTIGGPSVYPYQPAGLWEELNNREGFMTAYVQDKGENLYRRGLYTFWKRTVPPPALNTFDAPDREFCTVKRSRTNTPLQSLTLLHAPQFVEAARHLGARVMKEADPSPDSRLMYGFRLVASRPPTADELAILRAALDRAQDRFARDSQAAAALLAVGDSSRDENLNPIEHAAYAHVARIILNLDSAVTK